METTAPRNVFRPQRAVPATFRLAEEKLDHMSELNIIRTSSISWASALYMVPKCYGQTHTFVAFGREGRGFDSSGRLPTPPLGSPLLALNLFLEIDVYSIHY